MTVGDVEDRGGATPPDRWVQRPVVRFPWDALGPHHHRFASTREVQDYNVALCRHCGLRILHLWLNSRDWVRRRTEAVTFIDDRTVRRQVTVDFILPPYAPTLELSGRVLDTVPMALLQKRSLVKFDLRDHAGSALSLLGLRQQQTLTAAALKGLAASIGDGDPEADLPPHVDQLVERLVFGDRPQVHQAMRELLHDPTFAVLRDDALFLMTCERLLDSWVMCLLLQREDLTRRIVKFGYDEPLDLRYEAGTTGLRAHPGLGRPTAYSLQPADDRIRWSRLRASLGVDPVRIRFPVYAAESAQSFHLEVTAPPGAVIRAGQALASRPTGAPEDTSTAGAPGAVAELPRPAARDLPFDQVSGMHPTVDLHLTDVPSGAFSQAQVELRAEVSGWLLSMTIACWVNSLMLLVLTLTRWSDAVTDAELAVTLLVVFISFGSTVAARQDAHPMLSRLLSYAKGLAGISTLAALVGAGIVGLAPDRDHWLVLPTVVSALAAGALTLAAVRSRPSAPGVTSPWDFTPLTKGQHEPSAPDYLPRELLSDDRPADDRAARRQLGFDQPAVVVATAESERHRSRWSPGVEEHLRERLETALLRLDGRARTRGAPADAPCPDSGDGAPPP
ncbi:hypothetical protein ACI78V_20795 [Geodermatophilus sp. SYSU D00742]